MSPQFGLSSIGPLPVIGNAPLVSGQQPGNGTGGGSPVQAAAENFGKALHDALQRVNGAQSEADFLAVGLTTGRQDDIAAVMLATERAQLALQLAAEMRNKVLEGYQEIMRMQV